jgi:hypothetical protein
MSLYTYQGGCEAMLYASTASQEEMKRWYDFFETLIKIHLGYSQLFVQVML